MRRPRCRRPMVSTIRGIAVSKSASGSKVKSMQRHSSFLALAILLAVVAPSAVNAQTRAADGRPSLEGVWENNSATPLERPAQFANKPRLSDKELADLELRARQLFGPETDAIFGDGLYTALLAQKSAPGLGATGTYSQNWLPDRYFENRT